MANKKILEKAYAELMYLHDGKDFKSIALELGISEKTVGTWAKEGNWKTTKKMMRLSDEELANKQTLYLASYCKHIEERPENKNMPSSGEADAMAKIAATRERLLKTVVTVPQLYLFCKKLLAFISEQNLELAQEVIPFTKAFTDTEIEKYANFYE
jgi:hypothetical protein